MKHAAFVMRARACKALAQSYGRARLPAMDSNSKHDSRRPGRYRERNAIALARVTEIKVGLGIGIGIATAITAAIVIAKAIVVVPVKHSHSVRYVMIVFNDGK